MKGNEPFLKDDQVRQDGEGGSSRGGGLEGMTRWQ